MSVNPTTAPLVISFLEHERLMQFERQRAAAEQQRAVQFERQRYDRMHADLSAEISKLKRKLSDAKSKLKEQEQTPKISYKMEPQDNKRNLNWDKKLEQLKEYKERFGHCNVPSRDVPAEFKELIGWVSTQRTQYKLLTEGKRTSMTPERVRLLTAIGFQWSQLKYATPSWEERFQQLKDYKETHGHTRVPQKLESPAGLGNWVLHMRRLYREQSNGNAPPAGDTTSLSKERIVKLESIGFEWKLRNRSGRKRAATEDPEVSYDDGVAAAANVHHDVAAPAAAYGNVVKQYFHL